MPYETSKWNYYKKSSIAGTNYDWGVYNTISNGDGKNWRTLTQEEWDYVFNIRETNSGLRYIIATVNQTNGIILLPDDWDANLFDSMPNVKPDSKSYYVNVISETSWIHRFEANGAVFLPATCSRREGFYQFEKVISEGNYWSSTKCDKYVNCCYHLSFPRINVQAKSGPWMGYAVRLVRDVD